MNAERATQIVVICVDISPRLLSSCLVSLESALSAKKQEPVPMICLRAWLLVWVLLLSPLAGKALADVDLSLNLFPNSFADPSSGATWEIVTRMDTPGSQGVAAVALTFLDFPLSDLTASPVQGGLIRSMFGDETEFLLTFSSNTSVGLPANSFNLIDDPLGDNANWGNSSVIATGTIDDITALPQLITAEANVFNAQGQIVLGSIGTLAVRTAIPEPTGTAMLLIGGGASHCSVRRGRPLAR